MKVVLKPSVLQAIRERLDAARRDRRTIEHIIVSEEEYANLRHECYRDEITNDFHACYHTSGQNPCAEMTFKTIDLPDPHYGKHVNCRPQMRFAHRGEKLMGFDLYVVPARFAQ